MKPNNFSWIIDGKLAGSGYPFDTSNLEYYKGQGIKVIVNLSKKKTYEDDELEIYHRPISDFGIPSKKSMNEIITLINRKIDEDKPVLVHCIAGCGRTGTVIAGWLGMRYPEKNVSEVITSLRQERPCSIETEEQESFVHNYLK